MMGILFRTFRSFILIAALFVAAVLCFGIWLLNQVPNEATIRGCMTTALYSVHLCPGSADYVPLNQISPFLRKAVVLSEDSLFWNHHGFDFQEMQKSFEKNRMAGRFARGGSTITQQLAKNMFLTSEKTLERKLVEAVITVRIERALTKNQILERYLNVVQFGQDIFGVKQAASFYFQKTPAKLDVIESAFLAFLLPSPEKYSVSFYKKQLTPFAYKRLQEIIQRLYQYQRIGAADYGVAAHRLPTFLSKAKAPAAPAGLDLSAPEYGEGEDQGSWLEPISQSAERESRHQDPDHDQDERIDQEVNAEPADEQLPDNLNGMGERQDVNH
ncbi:MAG: monofunctional biosynthetic peptidoglycan transglycosylase [Bdellovibrio sp.]|nr:MAG: monofunctional biosynthetic peptidoglycan transglycosylase [Bdellovibrio sp.]